MINMQSVPAREARVAEPHTYKKIETKAELLITTYIAFS